MASRPSRLFGSWRAAAAGRRAADIRRRRSGDRSLGCRSSPERIDRDQDEGRGRDDARSRARCGPDDRRRCGDPARPVGQPCAAVIAHAARGEEGRRSRTDPRPASMSRRRRRRRCDRALRRRADGGEDRDAVAPNAIAAGEARLPHPFSGRRTSAAIVPPADFAPRRGASPRSVHQMQAAAATTAPIAPAASEIGVTCSVSDVVADSAGPPRSAGLHHQRRRRPTRRRHADDAADYAQAARPSSRKQSTNRAVENPTARSSPTSRARCSTASLKKSAASSSAETDEEEAEVGEVLAEVGRAARRGEALGPHVADREAHRHGSIAARSARAKRRSAHRRAIRRRAAAAHRCAIAVTRAPQRPVPYLQRNEGFRCRPVLSPVRLRPPADTREVDRERRIPVAEGSPPRVMPG